MAGLRRAPNGRKTISGLSVQQEAYCRARALGMSIEEALDAAKLKTAVKTARTWESLRGGNPLIKNRIDELVAIAQKNAILKSGLDREWVISRLMMLVERCMHAEPVKDRQGNEIGQYQFNATGANQALRALGDVIGLFNPVEKNSEDDLEYLSDDELARVAAELAAQTGLLEAPEGTQATAGRKQVGQVLTVSKAD